MITTNHELYSKVRSKRKELGLPVANLNIVIPNHPYEGKSLIEKHENTNHPKTIAKIHKMWYNGGWYLCMLYVDASGSYGVANFENINCPNAVIKNSIKFFHNHFEIKN